MKSCILVALEDRVVLAQSHAPGCNATSSVQVRMISILHASPSKDGYGRNSLDGMRF